MTTPTHSPNVLSTSKERVNLNMEPETVSDCCGAEVKVGMSGFGDGLEKYNYCSKCRKMCDLVKHNPPTEPTGEKWEPVKTIKELREWALMVLCIPEEGREISDEEFVDAIINKSVQEAKAELEKYCIHLDGCVLARWWGSRPTKDGGFEHKFGKKWYQSYPVDKTPKCTCGLDDLLSTLNTKESL